MSTNEVREQGKGKQINYTQDSSIFPRKKSCPGWDSNPRHSAVHVVVHVGLIIDAFGELRDKEDSITADMKNKCFVCGLPKTEFDHVAHGFDNHITRDHNAANYM